MNTHAAKLPVSYLFVPGNRPERFDKAVDAGADVVIVDLEDAVSIADKMRARIELGQWCQAHQEETARIVVRINDETTEWFDADLECIRASGILGVMLPKAEGAHQITRVHVQLPQAGFIVPIIETARGLLNVDAIAAAKGVQRLAFGTLDYAVDLDLSDDGRGLLYPACRIALASKAAGLSAPIAGVTADITNEDTFIADMAFARACGFGAKLCIHPKQVTMLDRLMTPSAAEVAWALHVIAAIENSQGAVQVDGRMVDRPVVLKAQAILERRPP